MRNGSTFRRSKRDVVAFHAIGNRTFAEVIFLLLGRRWTLLGLGTLLRRRSTLLIAAATSTAAS
jgi:hypothetical protein